jgi:high-affinity iron transporter
MKHTLLGNFILYSLLLLSSLYTHSAIANTETTTDTRTKVNYQTVVDEIALKGHALIAKYTIETALDSSDEFSSLYFDIFEGKGLETAIALSDPSLKTELESYFGTVIGLASQAKPKPQVEKAWLELHDLLQQTAKEHAQQGESGGFWSLVIQSFFILLREGFEAMLVITALITYLRRQEATDQLPIIYYSVGLALVASALTAYLISEVIKVSGEAQEALEGVTMLIAAVVLFYVSYWLISKSESGRWQAWIKGQINTALSKGSAFALGLAAFLAVYREGAETVLFYQALAGQSSNSFSAIGLGFIFASIALTGMYWVMKTASLRLPIGLFFTLTAILLYYLAVTFAGNGILELQEAKWVSITPVEWLPRITWLGLHPTVESVSAQILFLIPLPFAIYWWAKQRKNNPTENAS